MALIILFSLILLFSPVHHVHALHLPVGGTAPDFTLKSIDGEPVSLSAYKGKIVVLVYWKTGQDRSIAALEDSEVFLKEFKEKDVQFIGLIAGTENAGEVHRTVEEHEIHFPVLVDPGRQVYGTYGLRVYPSTIIIDREGKIARDIPGHAIVYNTILEGSLRHMLGEIDDTEFQELLSLRKEVKAKSTPQRDAERYYNFALKFTEAGLINHAITSAESSIESKPDEPGSHILLGFLFLKIKETELALKEFQTALELEPRSHDAKTGLGTAYLLTGRTDKAIEMLTEAATANPHPQMAYFELGRAYELKGEKDKAMEMYKKSLDNTVRDGFLYQINSQCK
jgi:cytochrome c biogenesis protein CcmG/thiol:disulfide interchange protein DsbE